MKKCEDCGYFVIKNPNNIEGQCFRSPPKILTSNARGTSVRCFHPITNSNGFCGEFVPKEEKGSSDDSQKTQQTGESEGFEGSSRTDTPEAGTQEDNPVEVETQTEAQEEKCEAEIQVD